MRTFISRFSARVVAMSALSSFLLTAPLVADHPVDISVPEGFEVQLAAVAPLVQHPMMGCFDERGRLFLAESAGRNLNEKQLDELRPNSIRMLEDSDGDGVFDRSTVFADKLAIPNGALWLEGSLYVAEPPGIWRFTDTDDDGVADVREHIAANVKSNGMSSTLHGPTLHPSGRLFWCGGQQGYNLDREGELPGGRIAPGIFSLLPDGTEHEVYAVGGRANPVEVAFSKTGDIFGTIAILDFPDGARHDALMHWVFGGLYASGNNVPTVIHQTGPRLPPLSHVGQVAPAGIARYRSDQFGAGFRGNLFWAQFNTHTVVRTTIEPNGATYTATDQDFAIGEHVDFHPTDVIEDADGSLLIIDTGGWFRHGCPTSRIARPEALGAIYRVRRTGAHQVDDPRGMQMPWQDASAKSLVARLDDPRPAVVERAMGALAKRPQSRTVLTKALKTSASSTTRINAVWSLSRQQTPAAFDRIIVALDDKAPEVRQAAANALGLARHHNAAGPLLRRVATDDALSVRREAAAAIGRIGKVESVRALVESLDDSPDPFFQHAVIDALVRIGHTQPLVEALTHESAAVRRGALLALNHFEVTISPQRIAPMLVDEDPALREAAFDIARGDRRLRPLLPEAISELLTHEQLLVQPDQRDSLCKTLSAAEGEASVQSAIAATFLSPSTSSEGKILLLDVMRVSTLEKIPERWLPAIESAMTADEPKLQEAALEVVSTRQLPEFDALLTKAARNDRLPPAIRLGSLEAVAPRLDPVPEDLLGLALDRLAPSHEPLHRATAARILAGMPLSSDQLALVADALTKADPLIVPALLNAFGRSTTASSGHLLLEALANRESLDALPAEQLSGLIRRFPPEIQAEARSILARLNVDLAEQKQRLEKLADLTKGGDVLRGKQVFFGKKASCSACHRVKGQGELVGPNLSTIASIRSPQDLLESIVFPSASIVQDYRPVVVVTTDGQIITGLEVRRTDEEVWLKGSDLKENRIRTADIEEMREATASVMPQGLEQKLSPDEIRDLMAFLLDLKPSPSYLLDE